MKHSIIHLFFVALGVSAILSGCTAVSKDANGQKEIRFTASIGNFDVKATDRAFENGDLLSLFADYPVENVSNVKLTAQGSALIPETTIKWGRDQHMDDPASFFAVYPYNETYTSWNDLYFTVQADQSTLEAYTASDLMTSAAYATPAEGAVHFRFGHRLSKLVIQIDNLLGLDIRQVSIGNVVRQVHFDIPGNDWSEPVGDPTTIKARRLGKSGTLESWVLILPAQGGEVELCIETPDDTFVYRTDYWVNFQAARCHNAHISIDRTSVAMDFTSDVIDWVEGNDLPFTQERPDAGN